MVYSNYIEKDSNITTLPKIDCYSPPQINEGENCHSLSTFPGYWEHFEITLLKHPTFGFGIAISGGCDDPHFYSGDSSIFISDVVRKGPACGLLQLNDIIASVNGVSFNNIDYISAINTIKNATQLRMIVKRRVPLPLIELEQRTLKFTLSKSRKKDDFGIVLGCKYYIKEITNPKLAEKDPGLKEGDIVLRINGQPLDDISIDDATKMLQKSKEKLSLVVQRDVKRGTPGSRWPSQNTVYERLGSVNGTPRHSPSPMMTNYYVSNDCTDINGHISKRPSSSNSTNTKKISDDHGNYNSGEGLYIPPQYCNNIKKDSVMTNSLGIGNSVPSNCSSPSINIVSQFSNNKESSRRLVVFKKAGNNLGIRVIGGNQAGIWISAIQEGSPAAMHGIRVGDKIISVNSFPMGGLTREEAVNYLLNLNEEVHAQLEFLPHEFEHIRINQLGDSFYIRTHFEHNKKNDKNELTFDNGDIFHVSDTLYGGSIGCWQVSRIYSANENDKNKERVGIIPNATTAEILIKQQKMETNTFAKSLFRKKLSIKKNKYLQGKDSNDNGKQTSDGLILPAYEKVSLRRPPFKRPIILYGPLADIARQLLLTNYSYCFAGIEEDKQIRLSNIDALINQSKHGLLNVSPESVEQLSYAQYAPIVILIDVETRSRIKELRQRAGGIQISSRKLIEQANKIKKYHGHLLSATLDATKEDGWFEALRQLIIHLQDRSVWMPEHKPSQGIEELVLNGWHDTESEEIDSIKGGGDYGNMGEYTNYSIYGGNGILDRESRFKNNEYMNRREITPVSAYRTQTESYLAPVIGPRRIHNATSYHEKYTTNRIPGTYDINQVLQDTFGDQVYGKSLYGNINDGKEQLLKHYDSRNYPRSPTNKIPSNTKKQLVNDTDITHHHTKDTSTDKSSSSSEISTINSKKIIEPTVIEHISSVIDFNGGKLLCPDSGVELIIPPGAIPSDHNQEIYIKICKDTSNAIPINVEKEKLLSPLVMCGPLGLKFLRPVELRFPKTFDGCDKKNESIEATQNNCFVLKSSCGEEWKNLEVSKENTNNENINQKYVAVSVMNF
ncbi:Polychaetoid [Strongyloides ratti]|uniref:Polychaetoid n=1 Tax=Strongyloides ratti TaxID=34506 RepID=A0A090L6H3_STRRB|nr:Polychaetoid [Strongyloides ratti]CEF65401.1 Polychaetoid [Strongyloides ratti]